MTTVEVLRKAKAELQRRGWYQGWFWPKGTSGIALATCPVCAAGAIRAAVNGDPSRSILDDAASRAFDLLEEAMCGSSPWRARNLIGIWNDAPGRTVEEIYEAFDSAIALAEGEARS